MSIVVVGSAALDNVKTPFGEVKEALGGSAIFFAAAASFFVPVKLVAVVGDDFPSEQLGFLQQRNVDLSGLEVAPGKTFRWTGVYHQDMNQRDTISTELNVFQTFSPKLPASYRQAPYLFLANIHPELQLDVLKQMTDTKLVMLDTMNLWIANELPALKKVMAKTDAVILNDQEARQITGETNLIKAARQVRQLGPRMVIVKKGEHGAFMVSDGEFFSVPAYPLEMLYDPTGAGDSFAGGLFGYLASCKEINLKAMRRAMVYGSVVASYAVEKFSIERLRDLNRDEIEERFGHFQEITRF